MLAKVERIVREEMDAIGSQEIMMPALQPGELWHESGRWDDYGPELMRLVDRHDREFCLGPTHEELITALVRNELRSYKELPLTLYQIQVKFRDEIRPRFGLLRSREFIMKDAYSFHASQESLQKTYDDMSAAYGRICERMDMDYRPVEADSGQIGGSVTCEFMALAEAGEAELVHCACGWAANAEAGDCLARPTVYDVPAMEKVATPGVHTIAELAAFLDIPESSTVKALSGKNDAGDLGGAVHSRRPRAERAEGRARGRRLHAAHRRGHGGLRPAQGLHGPGRPARGRARHRGAQPAGRAEVGRGRERGRLPLRRRPAGRGLQGGRVGRPLHRAARRQLPEVRPSARGSARHRGVAGVPAGDKYSKAMGATFMAEDGSEQPFLMGCYGVGVSRAMAAIVEQHNDENGIAWPFSVAPAHVCVLPLTVGDDEVQPAAEKLAGDLAKLGLEVVIDDRKERAGVKFADADLVGWPLQVVVGKRGLAEGKVEIKHRKTGARRDISLMALTDAVAFAQRNTKVWGSEVDLFGGLFA